MYVVSTGTDLHVIFLNSHRRRRHVEITGRQRHVVLS